MTSQNILDQIVKWAEKENAIKAVILQGSRAAGRSDMYSDYDLAVFCSTSDPYIEDEGWLSKLGTVWVCVEEKVSCGGQIFPTRLVIFEGGVKVDFSFFPLDHLSQIVHEYNQVILDKDTLTQSLQKPSHKEPKAQKPSRQEFLRTIEEFWFEAYHVAIYLKRGDLWSVKFRSATLHPFLLRMIEWEAQARNGWDRAVPPIGKQMASWVEPTIWRKLQGVFAHFDVEDSWRALLHTSTLFRRLSLDLSDQLKFDYPESLDKNISGFISKLHGGHPC